MSRAISIIETWFWGFWFSALTVFAMVNSPSPSEAKTIAVFAAVAVGLFGVCWVIRSKPRAQSIFNFTLATLWLLIYFLIGFPGTKLPSGDRATWAVLLLVVISLVPLGVLTCVRLAGRMAGMNRA